MNLICRIAPLALAVAPCVLPPAVYAQDAAASKPNRIVNRVAATVNGRPVTSSEVRARLAPYIRELMMLYPRQGPRFSAELIKAKKAVMQELIERELVLSEFETKGYQMPESVIDEEISRRVLMQFNGDRDALLDNLRKSGMTYSEFRESVRKETTVAAMRSSRYDRGIPPTPDEIREEYNATKHEYRNIAQDSIQYDKIFIPAMAEDPNVTPEDLYVMATELKKRLDKKEITFADAAREYSRDMHAQDGGAWPSIKRCDLSVDFANIVFSLDPGKIVGPLLDPAGFTIVRVRSKKLAPAPPLSNPEVKEKVDDAVRRKQSEARYRQWVDRLRDKAIIRTFI